MAHGESSPTIDKPKSSMSLYLYDKKAPAITIGKNVTVTLSGKIDRMGQDKDGYDMHLSEIRDVKFSSGEKKGSMTEDIKKVQKGNSGHEDEE